MFENNPREIKFKIGKKEYDEKVNDFYNLLVKSWDYYSLNDVGKCRFIWEMNVFEDANNEGFESEMKSKYSLPHCNQAKIKRYLHKLAFQEELKFELYSSVNVNIEFDVMCFAKALVFYICKLESLLNYSGPIEAGLSYFGKDAMLPNENLNFYKSCIEDNSNRLYDSLCEYYLKNTIDGDLTNVMYLEKREFSRVLNIEDKGADTLYITSRLKNHSFHELEEIREIEIELQTGAYYELLFRFGKERVIMSEVLAIQKYIAFLNNQIIDSNEKKPAFSVTAKCSDDLLKSLSEILSNDKSKNQIIHKIKPKDFAKIFLESTDVKIDFIADKKGDGLIYVLWFMYFMMDEFEFVKKVKGHKFGERISNCFLLQGAPISSDKKKLNTISVMYSTLQKPYRMGKNKKNRKFELITPKDGGNLSEENKHINSIFNAINIAIKLS